VSALHITNGDHAGDKLRGFVDAPVSIMADVLHEGPCPRVEGDAWHDVRARFLASSGGPAYEDIKTTLAGWDQAIIDACAGSAHTFAEGYDASTVARAASGGGKASAERNDIVLWFEHDLFDQLALIRTLDLVGRVLSDPASTADVRLICIGAFPGVDRFIGLGQLTKAQLATLVGTGVPVTRGHVALAADAWRAFRSPDPSDLMRIAMQLDASRVASSEGGAALPFLGASLLRFLAEFPSTGNGLSRTEQLALDALIAGPATAGALFAATQANEERPFMGDLTFFEIVRRLASAPVPLIRIDGGAHEADPGPRVVSITNAGRDVLAGDADHVGLNGIDIWRGGVHLMGSDRSPWRWDARDETLVS